MTVNNRVKVTVIGAGSWGTALADLLASNGHDVTLWAYEPELAEEITLKKTNSLYLPGFALHAGLSCTNDLEDALSESPIILLVAPVQTLRGVLKRGARFIRDDALILNASKGIEIETLDTVSGICSDILGDSVMDRYTALSGPTFAREVAARLPSLIVAASRCEEASKRVQKILSNSWFRVYTNSDVTGVELGGAVKNVIAIAAGISDGLGFGYNARAALITRGLNEMKRLGEAMGARSSTFSGLAGMGDLVLTCTGDLSRNRSVGLRLGKGDSIDTILGDMKMVAEGVKSAESVYLLSKKTGVEMPITANVYRILKENRPAREAVIDLMARDLKAEA